MIWRMLRVDVSRGSDNTTRPCLLDTEEEVQSHVSSISHKLVYLTPSEVGFAC